MTVSMVEGAFGMPYLVWTGGSLLTGYALYLHTNPRQFALLAGLPLIAQALTPIIAWLAVRSGHRKRLALITGLIGRLVWTAAPCLPLMPAAARLPMLLVIMFTSGVLLSAYNTLLSAWLGDVVPERARGRYFSFRGALHGFIGMFVALLGGVLLDHLAAPMKFQALLSVGVAFGVAALALVGLQWDPPVEKRADSLPDIIRAPLRDRTFRRFIGLSAYWAFAGALCGPFMLPYFYGELHLPFTSGAIYSALVATLGLLLVPQWGRLADRVGHKPVFAITAVGAGSLLPLVWTLATPGAPWIVWGSALLDTTVSGAGGAALGNLLLAQAPRAQRAGYISVLGMITGLAGFAGSLVAGQVIGAVNAAHLPVSGYQAVFLLAAALRVGAAVFLRRVREDQAWTVRAVLRLPLRLRAS